MSDQSFNFYSFGVSFSRLYIHRKYQGDIVGIQFGIEKFSDSTGSNILHIKLNKDVAYLLCNLKYKM